MASVPRPATRRRLPAPAGALTSSTTQIMVLVAVAAVVFLVGIIVGSHLFDPQAAAGTTHGTPVEPRRLPDIEDASHAAASATPSPPPAQDITMLAQVGPTAWADLTGLASLSLDSPVDAPQVSGGAWIYLDSRDKSATIKTVFANRFGGCTVDANHRGYSLYVNNWETSDRALVLEWRHSGGASGGGGGCARLSSDPDTVPYDKWVHVGFALPSVASDGAAPLSGADAAMLFLNGELLKTAAGVARGSDDVHPDRPAATVGGTEAGAALFTVGATADRALPFNGRIAQVFVAASVVTPRQLAAAASQLDLAGLAALAKAAGGRLLAAVYLASAAPASAADRAALRDAGVPLSVASAGVVVGELTGHSALLGGSPLSPPPADAAAAAAAAGRQAADVAVAVGGSGGGNLRGGKVPGPDAVIVPAAAAASPPAAVAAAPPAAAGDDGSAAHIPASILRASFPGRAPDHAPGATAFATGGNQWLQHTIRVPLAQASGATTDRAALAAGTFSDEVTAEELAASDATGRVRAAAVKAAMAHAWAGYKAYAWGADELKPRSKRGQDNWAGIGMTLVDSLDTLWVMGMQQEFAEAREWVATRLTFDRAASVSVFETTIRALGGLLSAYDLSGDRLFLDKAADLGARLLPAFSTGTGIPRSSVSLATGAAAANGWTGGASILSELGTLQVEFRYLSHATGQKHFGRKAEAVIEKVDSATRPPLGLFPIYISADTGAPTTSQVTFGALGDSFYEYLIKVWVQGGRSEGMYRRMFDAAMEGMTAKLLKRSQPSSLLYVADWDGANTQDKMDHLVCFVPGMLALGAYNARGTAGEAAAVRDLTNAKALAYTCWQMYERTATGIAPEFVEMPGGRDPEPSGRAPFYILRPEAAESLFVLHQLTGNPVYREWGWRMFQAIDKHCKVEAGYGAFPDVRDPGRQAEDRMESFFLAETLKYLYMLQSPDHTISLEKYVFNTEAHPMRVFNRAADGR